jgi:hypothetical protein
MKALGPEAIIWDMDGTLVDTAQHHFSAWRNVCTCGRSSAADLRAAGADLVIKNLEFIDLPAVETL